ncbi:MAG: response regulator [Gemmatimonadota bacterium]|nr:response regulator [Gemmatimonadota bacterium]MDH3426967.1 response regulator [Gemmatimonadota bacterium]
MNDRPVILIADGVPGTVPEMGPVLKALGYDVSTAPDAPSVVMLARQRTPVMVILGLRLPGGGARTALKQLRASEHGVTIPVIALSPPGAGRQELLSAGVFRCLEPPVREKDILAALDDLLEMREEPEKRTERSRAARRRYPRATRLLWRTDGRMIRSPDQAAG